MTSPTPKERAERLAYEIARKADATFLMSDFTFIEALASVIEAAEQQGAAKMQALAILCAKLWRTQYKPAPHNTMCGWQACSGMMEQLGWATLDSGTNALERELLKARLDEHLKNCHGCYGVFVNKYPTDDYCPRHKKLQRQLEEMKELEGK